MKESTRLEERRALTWEAQFASTTLPSELPMEVGAIMRTVGKCHRARLVRSTPLAHCAARRYRGCFRRGLTAPLSAAS